MPVDTVISQANLCLNIPLLTSAPSFEELFPATSSIKTAHFLLMPHDAGSIYVVWSLSWLLIPFSFGPKRKVVQSCLLAFRFPFMLITKSCCCFSAFSGISPPARFKKSCPCPFVSKTSCCCFMLLIYLLLCFIFCVFCWFNYAEGKGTPFIMRIRQKSQEVVHFYSSSIVLKVVLKFIIFLANKNSLQPASQRTPRNARIRSEKVWKEGRTSGRTITWCPPRVPSLSCKYDKLR